MIWRDDDILMPRHSLDRLLAADDMFQRHGVLHTVAIIAETLTPAVAKAIVDRRMSAQLHCWSHVDLTASYIAIAQLPQAVARIEDMIGIRPTVLYPPWNRVSAKLVDAAKALRLEVSWRKISLEQFIRCEGDVSEDVLNFHYWHQPDVDQLELAMSMARKS